MFLPSVFLEKCAHIWKKWSVLILNCVSSAFYSDVEKDVFPHSKYQRSVVRSGAMKTKLCCEDRMFSAVQTVFFRTSATGNHV